MKKFLRTLLILVVIGVSGRLVVTKTNWLNQTTITQEEPIACTLEYAPVCAKVNIQCITTPCDPIEQTFGNRCVMDANPLAEFLYDGECKVGNSLDNGGALAPLGKNPSLSLALTQGWEGKNITGIINNDSTSLRIPIKFLIKNTSNTSLLLPPPVVDEMYPASSFLISCVDEGYLFTGQTAHTYFAYSPYAITNHQLNDIVYGIPFMVDSAEWSENVAGIGGSISSTMLWAPPSTVWIKTAGSTNTPNIISGHISRTCNLFVNVLAGDTTCKCTSSTDIACFKNCYPDLQNAGDDYMTVVNNAPSKYRTKAAQQTMKFYFTGAIIGEFDEFAQFNVSFSLED